ncbi:hypothetical protein R6Q57_010986 [Mikania cordata]
MGERYTPERRKFNSFFDGIVGDGKSHRFWLEKTKDILIENKMSLGWGVKILSWEWRRDPTTHQEVSDLFGLLNLINDHSCDSGVVSWKWHGGGQDHFSVYSAKKLIYSSQDYVWVRVASWCKMAPILAFEASDLLLLSKVLKLRKQESRTM